MTNNVVQINEKAATPMREMGSREIALVRQTLAKDCTDSEFDLFMTYCKHAGLDPFRRQAYALVFSKENSKKRQMSIITGIDGYRAMAARNGDYRPDNRAPRITYDENLKDALTNPLGIESCEVSCFKKAGGEWHEIVGVAYWDEFAPVGEEWAYDPQENRRKPTGKYTLQKDNWKRMARVMIAKCAEAQALRRGWPEDVSGSYIQEEVDRATIDLTPSEAVEHQQKMAREEAIGGKGSVPLILSAGQEMVPAGKVVDRVAEHVQTFDDHDALTTWAEQNRASFRMLWAASKADGLEVKRLIEERQNELAAS